MYQSAIISERVETKLSLPSVLLRGMVHQDKFSMDIGVTRPEGFYVYRARLVEGSIRPPYRQMEIDSEPTPIITPRHLDGMLAEIVRIHFDEELRPLRLASDMNWGLYQQLYRQLVKQ